MARSESGERLGQVLNKAIEDHFITTDEHNEIICISLEDGHIFLVESTFFSAKTNDRK